MATIEYCLKNVDAATRERLSDIDCSVERRCLQRCGDCYRSEFLVVDGTLQTGESHEALLATTEVEES